MITGAAISGAVRYLVRAGLLARERAPGARVDHYRVYDDDIWSAITLQRQPLIDRYVRVLSEDADELDPSKPGDRRLLETLEFYRFAGIEMPAMIERWKEHRRDHKLGREPQ